MSILMVLLLASAGFVAVALLHPLSWAAAVGVFALMMLLALTVLRLWPDQHPGSQGNQ